MLLVLRKRTEDNLHSEGCSSDKKYHLALKFKKKEQGSSGFSKLQRPRWYLCVRLRLADEGEWENDSLIIKQGIRRRDGIEPIQCLLTSSNSKESKKTILYLPRSEIQEFIDKPADRLRLSIEIVFS